MGPLRVPPISGGASFVFARASGPEIAELESRMTDTHAWGRDKAGQERIAELYEAYTRFGIHRRTKRP